MKKLLAVIISAIFILSAMPFTAYADGEVIIDLAVTEGEDICEVFNTEAKKAKGDDSGTIYKINIPAGKYTASKQLVLWSNTYVYMNGVTIERVDGFNMLRFGSLNELKSNPATGYDGFSNIKIEGG
ncbi:MAG: hypothetical protein IKI33_03365, partial [Eubacterium sp.]|nr:hypothetical protein [Eubacterium sp.]